MKDSTNTVKNSDKDVGTKKAVEEKNSQNSNTKKIDNFVDITKEKSYWDKAVPS